MSSGKYHILFLTRWYPNRYDVQLGIFIQKHAQAVAQYCNVSVLYVQAVKGLKKNVEIEEIVVNEVKELRIYYKAHSLRMFNYLKYVIWHLKGYKRLNSNGAKIDLIHLHVMFGLGLICRLLSKIYNKPYMVTEHWHGFTDGQFEHKSNWFKIDIYKTAFQAKAFTAVSGYLKKALEKNGFKNPIEIIPNVVEISGESLNKSSEGVWRFLTVADLLDKVKNISSVIEVMQEIMHELPGQKIEYHIIGGGIDEVDLKALAHKEKRYLDTIIFHGRQTNDYVLDFIQKCNCSIINSTTETFSVFAAESLLSGIPVISTKCGGPEEFLDETKIGRAHV